jgi:hypothetical protein
MTSLDNLEKLIQMATIEHMYSMLQKISNKSIDNTSDTEKHNYTESSTNTYANTNNDEIITRLNSRVNQLETEMTNLRLSVEEELTQLRSNTHNNSKYLCQQIRGQQVLTSYPGFSTSFKLSQKESKLIAAAFVQLGVVGSDKIIDEHHIVSLPTSEPFANIILKIEEKIASELDTLVQPEELKSLEEE